MDEVTEISEDDKTFITPYLPSGAIRDDDAANERPFVTLTYACSMDSMISLSPGVRTTLSGPKTKSMTHYLRSNHEAILVGVGTAIADDPSLTCRYPRGNAPTAIQPIILDPQLRWDVQSSKAVTLARKGESKAPWILHAESASPRCISDSAWEYIPVPDHVSTGVPASQSQSRLQWVSILRVLMQRDIKSVMIEGGATVINDLLLERKMIDSVIVTMAPTWLGEGGVAVSPSPIFKDGIRVNAACLKQTAWRQFGDDAVVCGRLV
jgi:2,5-diamino-6-(ribosylamino)-4(3H)-pyrimidinone 5'-phosphate reductase